MDRVLSYVRGKSVALLLAPAILILLVLFAYPLIQVVQTSLFDPGFTLAHFQRFVEIPVYITVLYRTVRVSVVVTFWCFVIGYPTAYFLAHTRPKVRIYLVFLILLPFWMSILIRTYSWIALLGSNGLVNTLLLDLGFVTEPVQMLYTTGTVYIAMVQILLPIMILTCYSVMLEINEGLVKAARVLGASPWRAFLRVYFPLSAPGATTGAIIIFILSMGFFITPALIGGRQDIMAGNLIEFQVTQMVNFGFASALGILLLIITLTIVLLFRALTKTRSPYGNA